MEKFVKLFLKETDYCKKCGSQRCDRTFMWIAGCQYFKNYIKDFSFDKMNSNYYYRND